jgi:hypothetical protein
MRGSYDSEQQEEVAQDDEYPSRWLIRGGREEVQHRTEPSKNGYHDPPALPPGPLLHTGIVAKEPAGG